MELDEMKQAWQTLSRQLEQQQALNIRLFTDSRLDRVRQSFRPFIWGQFALILLGVLLIQRGVSFWLAHLDVTHLIVWGVLVQAFGISVILACAWNLHFILGIDYAAPVLDIQQRIAALRRWRVKFEVPVFLFIGSFGWIPLVLEEAQRQAFAISPTLDLMKVAPESPKYLILSGFVSVVLVGGVFWLVRRVGHRRWLENSFAGTSVQKAELMLEQIARFQQE
jgi:hypothetical protein